VIWRVEWLINIRQQNVLLFDNPKGKITNSDLEMVGMLIHYYLVLLEHLVLLKHVHVAAWWDNTPTVSWTNKWSSSRAAALAGCLLTRALALIIHAKEASPLISVSITGVDNTMAGPMCCHAHSITTLHLPTHSKFQVSMAYPQVQNDSWSVSHLSVT
jgi:hypothetical protein